MTQNQSQLKSPEGALAAPSESETSQGPPADVVRRQLGRILASKHFSGSERLSRFLRFAVEQTLSGDGARLKESLVGAEVFDRRRDYDPRIDPIVRVEARRLRSKLKAYYGCAGDEDDILIEFPKGTYTPALRLREDPRAVVAATVQPEPCKETSIAVLPFLNVTREPEDEALSDGLTEELIHRLTRVCGLRVVAWQSASQLRGREEDLAGIRSQLDVDLVLRGSVRRASGRARIMVQLIDTATSGYLWSESYDPDLRDLLSTQDQIARAIVKTLELTLTPQKEYAKSSPLNPRSFEIYFQGRYHWNKRTREGFDQSIRCFEESAESDPHFALPHAGLADALSMMAAYGYVHPAEVMPKARLAALKALDLDPNCAEACTSLALIRSHYERDWAQAEALYRRAIEMSPGYATAHFWLGGECLARLGRFDEAEESFQAALRLDPLSLIIRDGPIFLSILRRDYRDAQERCQRVIDLDPAYYKFYATMGRILIQLGRYDDAVRHLRQAHSMASRAPGVLSALIQGLCLCGHSEEARARMADLTAMAEGGYVPSTAFAIAHLGFGDKEGALRWVQNAYDRREITAVSLGVHPVYDPLRSDPQFQAVLRGLGLAIPLTLPT